ncbi:hypothetical protein LTR37_021074 [Vermiconidia calcicola]|uniref:Uncharacterized protein n=1 Tax=Vermiconidia calcicola TaxID=1690605 RepID=A0ACC3MAW9_9PEZI|nr:hypothetical protein LTR37_021074 [Vermiconidia calcicola]
MRVAFLTLLSSLQVRYNVAAAAATQLCGILDQRSALVGDRLYFSSGNYTFDDDLPWHNTSSLYVLPLDKAVDVSGPIPLSELEISPLPSQELAGGVGPISGGAGGTYLFDHTALYAYGGIIGGDANGTENGLWTYNTTKGTWGLTIVEGGGLSYGEATEGVWASDPSQSLSFYTGGWTIAYNNTNNGLVKFDSSDPAEPQWNFATALSGDMQGPNILKGSMQFVRKGQAGILVAFGGYNTTKRGTQFGPGWDWDQRSLSDIFVYDIFSNVWYLVEATGDLPPLRTEFCSGVSSAADDSSFQITIHGGWDQLYAIQLDDTYVLTLPSFEWIRVRVPNNPDGGAGRNRHKYSVRSASGFHFHSDRLTSFWVWQDAQMIIAGGGSSDYCNTSYPPIKVLDTSNYVWQTHFEPDHEAYSVPGVVRRVIGGGPNGGSTVTSPKRGWTDPALGEIFSHTLARDTYIYSDPSISPETGDAAPTPTPEPPGTQSNSGAIAGGVVGGVLGLALIAAAIWWFLVRPRQRRARDDGNQDGSSAYREKPELPSNGVARADELDSRAMGTQLPTKTDTAELEDHRYAAELAAAMQGVQSPVELEAEQHRRVPGRPV